MSDLQCRECGFEASYANAREADRLKSCYESDDGERHTWEERT